jgi:colicin import membrane protein
MPLDSAHYSPSPAARRASKWPSLALALALHIALGILVFWGWRSHSIKAQDDAAPAQVGLWTTADIAHAAKKPEPQKAAPQTKTKPERKPEIQHERPAPQDDAADIHLGQTKPKKKHTPKPEPSPQPTAKPTEKPKAKPSPAPTHKPTAKPTTKPTPDPRIEQEKQRQEKAKAEKLAEAKSAEKAQEKARQDALKRMLGEAKNAGQTGSSTTSKFDGQGKAAYKPSNEYSARLGRAIRRDTNFDASDIAGNPSVEIEIRLAADGEVLGRPIILRPSGNSAWDAAAVAGIQRASPLPVDAAWGGKAPPPFAIIRTPKD